MSNLTQDILFLLILTFIVQYYLISWISLPSYTSITNSLGKIYLSTIVATCVAFVYVLLHDYNQLELSCNYYIGLGIIIGLITYAYRNQIGITDLDWTNWMLEHQNSGLMISTPILSTIPQTTIQTQTQNLASQIISTQQDQINSLNQLINQIKIKKST